MDKHEHFIKAVNAAVESGSAHPPFDIGGREVKITLHGAGNVKRFHALEWTEVKVARKEAVG
jgi:hypothetical protein